MNRLFVKVFWIILICCCIGNVYTWAHLGPDPVSSWFFDERFINDGVLTAQKGADLNLPDGYFVGDCLLGKYLDCCGITEPLIISDNIDEISNDLPRELITITAWVTIDRPEEWGGIIGLIQDNDDYEKGWILGYNKSSFYFGLSTKGADDGNGKMTYLKGKTRYNRNQFYYLVATYDGREMNLYVNGKLDASDSNSQSGEILYPDHGKYVIGGYCDDNEKYIYKGALRSISVYDLAAKQAWVTHQYADANTEEVAIVKPNSGGFVIEPYLQYVTQDSIVVKWETTEACIGQVQYGETSECEWKQSEESPVTIHEVKLSGLKPETQYFYSAGSKDNPGFRMSDVFTFQTANKFDTPYAFVIFGDTQDNLPVAKKLARYAWAQRPNFCLHAGDLVGQGSKKSDWVDEFFPSMHELICRVPLIPVLGNHEGNAKHYYNYMALPEPEYYYEFKYGNAQFFMVDSNKKLNPGSEQFKWLDRELGKSRAKWKFVCHHHPPYSSDENDYGNLWTGNKSTRGDLKVRQLAELYDKHSVDIVWSGHIHSYERTWPVRDNSVVDSVKMHGTIYMVTGGGGGGLETPGPSRPFFQNTVKHGHHYCIVAINGPTLEFKAFDLENRLFDQMKITRKD